MKILLALPAALALTACGANPCPEPLYDGKATDEAWRTMKDGEPRAKQDGAKAVTLLRPTAGEQLPSASLPTFAWTSPLTAARFSPAPRPSILSRLGGLVYSSAWAHLPPVTGPLHLLRITVPERTCPIEVLTTQVEWIPSTPAWTALKDTAGKPLRLDVFSAYLQENRITEGPYHLTTPLTFSVAP